MCASISIPNLVMSYRRACPHGRASPRHFTGSKDGRAIVPSRRVIRDASVLFYVTNRRHFRRLDNFRDSRWQSAQARYTAALHAECFMRVVGLAVIFIISSYGSSCAVQPNEQFTAISSMIFIVEVYVRTVRGSDFLALAHVAWHDLRSIGQGVSDRRRNDAKQIDQRKQPSCHGSHCFGKPHEHRDIGELGN
ncbi:hypothetical protein ABH973_000878 [Bradyrhizobium ottawaense]